MTGLLAPGPDGRPRCWWAASGGEACLLCHDQEWGRPAADDRSPFEMPALEGFQAGPSWATILHQRPAFRAAFAGFDPGLVAGFGEAEVARLLTDAGIVRHRGKIEAAVSNAGALGRLIGESGSLAACFWPRAAAGGPAPGRPGDLPAETPASRALSRDLKAGGFSCVGPTIVYAFMQAVGLVDGHAAGCAVRPEVERERRPLLRRFALEAGR